MDYQRKFILTSFFCYQCSLTDRLDPVPGGDIIDLESFLASARIVYPQLSDDSINLIFKSYRDTWSLCPDKSITDTRNLFYSLVHFTQEILCSDRQGHLAVRFEKLFKWREVTEYIGETLPICANLAYMECFNEAKRSIHNFEWACVLPSDNAQLRDIFERERLIDLHQHLKASTSVFDISWICLMNHTSHRGKQFKRLLDAKTDNPQKLYDTVRLAALIRLELYRAIVSDRYRENRCLYKVINDNYKFVELQFEIDYERTRSKQNLKGNGYVYDYASPCNDNPMAIFTGERLILYETLRHIYRGDSERVSALLHRYILIKSHIRECFVQLDDNMGFANFNCYETKKETFIDNLRYKHYSDLMFRLPMYEAHKFYYQDYIETRIAPQYPYRKMRERYSKIEKLNQDTGIDYRFIYHFIKIKENSKIYQSRNYRNRKAAKKQALALKKLLSEQSAIFRVVGIDAANSEMNCRPEAFSETYKMISEANQDIGLTYHVGEDFYDIADGLRAIDEAIRLLKLRRGDRLGHCIALGILPEKFYQERDKHLIIPQQVLVDNMVWIKMKAAEYNVTVPPMIQKQTEEIFEDFRKALRNKNADRFAMDIIEYGRAMQERIYSWDDYEKYMEDDNRIGKINYAYDRDEKWRVAGETVVEFVVSDAYIRLMHDLQNRMMDDIELRQIVIECCPSSNIKIGRLGRLDCHPIFRFFDPAYEGHHIPVTVNTDDLGIFPTSLPREFELLALAMLKKRNNKGDSEYNSIEVYEWVWRLVRNAHIYRFGKQNLPVSC